MNRIALGLDLVGRVLFYIVAAIFVVGTAPLWVPFYLLGWFLERQGWTLDWFY